MVEDLEARAIGLQFEDDAQVGRPAFGRGSVEEAGSVQDQCGDRRCPVGGAALEVADTS